MRRYRIRWKTGRRRFDALRYVGVTGPRVIAVYGPTALPAGFLPGSGGTLAFSNNQGGSSVGAFTEPVNIPAPIAWTNKGQLTTVNRSEGLTLTWTGGDPNAYLSIGGNNTAAVSYGPQFLD